MFIARINRGVVGPHFPESRDPQGPRIHMGRDARQSTADSVHRRDEGHMRVGVEGRRYHGAPATCSQRNQQRLDRLWISCTDHRHLGCYHQVSEARTGLPRSTPSPDEVPVRSSSCLQHDVKARSMNPVARPRFFRSLHTQRVQHQRACVLMVSPYPRQMGIWTLQEQESGTQVHNWFSAHFSRSSFRDGTRFVAEVSLKIITGSRHAA